MAVQPWQYKMYTHSDTQIVLHSPPAACRCSPVTAAAMASSGAAASSTAADGLHCSSFCASAACSCPCMLLRNSATRREASITSASRANTSSSTGAGERGLSMGECRAVPPLGVNWAPFSWPS
jgi:hypothetical protein